MSDKVVSVFRFLTLVSLNSYFGLYEDRPQHLVDIIGWARRDRLKCDPDCRGLCGVEGDCRIEHSHIDCRPRSLHALRTSSCSRRRSLQPPSLPRMPAPSAPPLAPPLAFA